MEEQLKTFPQGISLRKSRAIGIENEMGLVLENVKENLLRGNIYLKTEEVPKEEWIREIHGGNHGAGHKIHEFKTIPLSLDKDIRKRNRLLKKYYEEMSKFTEVTNGAGTHIHISIIEKDNPDIVPRVLLIASTFFTEIQKIAGRTTHWAKNPQCKNIAMARSVAQNMRYSHQEGAPMYARRYYNITPTSRGTLEFRAPKGSTNYSEIQAWIQFLRNIIDAANRESIEGLRFEELLKGRALEAYVKKFKRPRNLTRNNLNKTITGDQLNVRD